MFLTWMTAFETGRPVTASETMPFTPEWAWVEGDTYLQSPVVKFRLAFFGFKSSVFLAVC